MGRNYDREWEESKEWPLWLKITLIVVPVLSFYFWAYCQLENVKLTDLMWWR